MNNHQEMSVRQENDKAEKTRAKTVWISVPLFFCLIAPRLQAVPVLQGFGQLYLGMLAALFAYTLGTGMACHVLRLEMRAIKLGLGPPFAMVRLHETKVQASIIPLSASVTLLEDAFTKSASWKQQFKQGISGLSGHLGAGTLGVMILGPNSSMEVVRELAPATYGLLTGPLSLYGEIGGAIIRATGLEIIGKCLLISAVINLLPLPILGGGQFCLGVLALLLRRNVHEVLGKALQTGLGLSLVLLLGLFVWIVGRAFYYLCCA